MGSPNPRPARVPTPVSMPLLVISPKKSTFPAATAPPAPTCCCAAYGPPPSPLPSPERLRPDPLEERRPAVVNAYEKIRSMLPGETPPPWSRMRRESVAGLVMPVSCRRGGGTMVISTGGSGRCSWWVCAMGPLPSLLCCLW